MPETHPFLSTRELVALTGQDAARVSDFARGLGFGIGKGRPRAHDPAEATLILIARRLMDMGLSMEQGIACARELPLAELRAMIADDQYCRWLVVLPDPARRGEFLCRIADSGEMLELGETGGGSFRGLRIVDLRSVLKEVFAAAVEARRQATAGAASHAPGKRVTRYSGDRRLSGVFVRSGGRIDLVREGRGLSIELTADELREMADALERVAAEGEAGPKGSVN